MVAQLLSVSVKQGISEQKALRISIDSPPSTDVTLQLNVISKSASSSFFPKTVAFQAGVVMSTVVSFTGSTAEPCTLDFKIIGAEQTEFEIIYPRGNVVSVLAAEQKVPPPTFLSAGFSATGAFVTVAFSGPTNKARLPSVFSCPLLLDFRGSADAQCAWSDAATVTIYPAGSNGLLTPKDPVRIASGSFLQALCTVQCRTNI